MKNQLLLFSFLVLLFTSCSNDSESNNDSILIKKIVSVSNGSSNTTNFFYDGNKLTSIQVGTVNLNYTYLDNNIINIKRNNGSFFESETIFEYDNQERIISELYIDNFNDFSERTVYEYQADNTIAYQKYFGDAFSQPNIGNSGVIYNTNLGETYKIEQFSQGQLFRKSVWTYDTKNNPLKNIVGFNKQPLHAGKFHNYLTSDLYQNFELVSNSTFEYSYNGNDFPIQCIQNLYHNAALSSTVEINYFYE